MELKKVLEEIKEALAKADLETIKACTSPEEVYKNLQKYGLKISYEEMKEALEACSNEELSDEALEGIAGGRAFWEYFFGGLPLLIYDAIAGSRKAKPSTEISAGPREIIRCGGPETPVNQATGTPGSSSGSVITQKGNNNKGFNESLNDNAGTIIIK
ncbi:MAG: hypothetical protein ACI3ZR_04120 [bacterium]